MEYYNSKGYTTENGVYFKFQNNYVIAHLFKEPIFIFDGDKLTHVQFDGLAITTVEEYKKLSALEQRVKALEAELGVWENRETFWDETNKKLEAERENFKRVLEGMEYENLDLIAAEKRDTIAIGKEAKKRIDEIIKQRDDSRTEIKRLHARLTEQADEFGRQIQSLHLDVAARDGEIVRLRDVLQKISVWGCSGHCVDLCGSKCPCCMAEEVLGGGEWPHGH